MMTFAKGMSGTPASSAAMADYYSKPTMTPETARQAAYYLRSVRADLNSTPAAPAVGMSPEVAAMLGLDLTRTATKEEVTNLLSGLRADGQALPGQQREAEYTNRQRIAYYDFTLSAPKSVSVAMALAPTEGERFVIVGAHQEACAVAMDHLHTKIANVRRGHAGSHGADAGEFGYVSFMHLSSRPTVFIPHTEADGTPSTIIQEVGNAEVPGDMQLHTHHIVPNAVRLPDGTVGTLDTLGLHDAVHEAGGVYQAALATRLRAQGIVYDMDPRTELGRIPTVSPDFCEAMSKRRVQGGEAARQYACGQGLDWDKLGSDAQVALLRAGTQGPGQRRAKSGEAWAEASWVSQAKAFGYEHKTQIDPERKGRPLPSREDRLLDAYRASLPVLGRQLDKKSVLNASAAQVAATRGLIVAGMESPADVDAITRLMREHGVRHAGYTTPLVWAQTEASTTGALADRRPQTKITTELHLHWERRATTLMQSAAADKSSALTQQQIERAVVRVEARDGISLAGEHGQEQRQVIDAIAAGGKFVAVVGSAGAGKTTLLSIPVEAWKAERRQVYGTALAWRQANPLGDIGIPSKNAIAIAPLLHRIDQGEIKLDRRSVLIVDELSQIGTQQQLRLLELRDQIGFMMVGVGDDRQGSAIDAGNSYELIRRALGKESVTEIQGTVRQLRQRDRETATLFREGRAGEGIARLQEDGHARLVPGGREHAIKATADLWAERTAANVDRKGYSLSISAPTNQDARDIGAAIREVRRGRGEVRSDAVRIDAQDQTGATYTLPLAQGDRVRLFATTRAKLADGRGTIFGNNGSVIEVGRIEASGFHAVSAKGKQGFVTWDALRHRETGRIQLTYGDAVSIDAVQGVTSTEHLNVVPDGSVALNAKKAYVAGSRSREATYLIVSDGRERQDIEAARPIGDAHPIGEDQVWAHVAANFSRQQEKELATQLLDRSTAFRTGTARGLASAFQGWQQREADGKGPFPGVDGPQRRREEQDVAASVTPVAKAAAERAEAVRRIAAPSPRKEAQAVRDARRSVRNPASRPKQQKAAPMTTTEAQAEFADALHRAGLRPSGAPTMDGKLHRVAVEGDKRGKRSGSYVGHLDGMPAGFINNFKTGQKDIWRASRPQREMTAAERAAEMDRVSADRAAREATRHEAESGAAQKATTALRQSRPATAAHPYLTRKGVQAHGLRQDRRGNLLVPMHDLDGKLWGIQTIAADGGKLFTKGARKQGAYTILGTPSPDSPLLFAEGMATAATVREATGFAVVVAFDAGNLQKVVEAFREREPNRQIVIMADNDHHLPRQEPPKPNVGVEKAQAAAEATGGVVLLPSFAPGDAGTDWNDYAAQHGKVAAQAAIQEALRAHGIELPVVSQTQRDAARAQAKGARPATSGQDAARRATQHQGPDVPTL